MEENNKIYGLKLNIEISDKNIYFDPNKVKNKYIILEKENSFYFLKNNYEGIAKGEFQGFIEEDEYVIFQIEFGKDNVQLINLYYKEVFRGRLEQFYDYINEFNFKLYKMILKCEEENEKNMNYSHILNIYDIIRIKEVKLLLRDYKINNDNKILNDKNPEFIVEIKNEKIDKCDICNESGSSQENPLINLCKCKVHFICKKNEIKEKLTKFINKEEKCIKYSLKTTCSKCSEIFPLFFIYNNKQYELLDIDRKETEEFLLFESLDYYNNNRITIDKYIYYIKLDKNKNKETIVITGSENKSDIDKYDNLIEIDDNLIDKGKAMIECDKSTHKLILKNIGNENNISILQESILLKPDDGALMLNLANIQVEAKLISSEGFDEVEKEMEKNNEIIEERKE